MKKNSLALGEQWPTVTENKGWGSSSQKSPLPPGLVAFTRSACGGFKIILSETAISHSSLLF